MMSLWHISRPDRLVKKRSVFALWAWLMFLPGLALPEEFHFPGEFSVSRALVSSHFRDGSGIIKDSLYLVELRNNGMETTPGEERWRGINAGIRFNVSVITGSRGLRSYDSPYRHNSLVAAAVITQANELFGVELTPHWSPVDELQVDISNWTKSALELEKLIVELSLIDRRPCRFKYERRLELAPTETITSTVADTNAAQGCLEMQGVAADNALRFVNPTNCSGAHRSNLLKANAVLQVQGRAVLSQTCWVVEAEVP